MATLKNDGLRLLIITNNKSEVEQYTLKCSELGISENLLQAESIETARGLLNKYDQARFRWVILIDLDDDLLINQDKQWLSSLQIESFKIHKPAILILSSCEEDDTLFMAAKHPETSGFILKSDPEENLTKALKLAAVGIN